MEYAKYVGTADSRYMSRNHWLAAGIEDQGTVTWDRFNGYTQPRSAFSDDAWAVLANDPGMVFTGERPDAHETTEAAIQAATNRLRARQDGETVLHAQDEIPGSM